MYKYETHLHTYPVSKDARFTVRENLQFYKEKGYDGVFITNHFLDGNINISPSESYAKKIEFYFSDYRDAVAIGKELGIKVFLGVEMSYGGTDFLIYGLNEEWFAENPQIMDMSVKKKLAYIKECGGYVVHAHPFREAGYIDHIRLYPRSVDAVEVINACCSEFVNKMALTYADNYKFAKASGTDNHVAGQIPLLSGVMTDTPINSETEYIELVKNEKVQTFIEKNEN